MKVLNISNKTIYNSHFQFGKRKKINKIELDSFIKSNPSLDSEALLKKEKARKLQEWKSTKRYVLVNKFHRYPTGFEEMSFSKGNTILTQYIQLNPLEYSNKHIIGFINNTNANYIDINTKNDDGNTALLLACQQKDRNEVTKTLLKHKDINSDYDCDINVKNNDGNTALLITSQKDNTEIAKMLIQHKDNNGNYDCDINVQDKYGNSALIWACENNNTEIAKALLEHKNKNGNYDCDINVKNNDGISALLITSFYGNTEILKMLLNHKNKNSKYDCTIDKEMQKYIKQNNDNISKEVKKILKAKLKEI